jgi:dihydrofolate reductase
MLMRTSSAFVAGGTHLPCAKDGSSRIKPETRAPDEEMASRGLNYAAPPTACDAEKPITARRTQPSHDRVGIVTRSASFTFAMPAWLTEHLGTSDPEIDDLPPGATDPDISFIGDLDTAVRVAKDAAGGKYVNVLGANVAKQCLEAGLLDEILVLIAPVLLGDGVRLFQHAGGATVRLEPIDPQRVGPTSLWLRVGRQAADSSSS